MKILLLIKGLLTLLTMLNCMGHSEVLVIGVLISAQISDYYNFYLDRRQREQGPSCRWSRRHGKEFFIYL